MHIPDGYLSPETCAIGYAIAVPAVGYASHRVRAELRTRQVPTLAMFSAASFLIMMVNLPVPGGTTAHAVGAVLIAIVLGPWAAVVAIAVALGLQALMFGDGGVLAWGVNVANMAVLLPFVGTAVDRLVAGASPAGSRRRTLAAAVGGYVGILAAALAVGVELGIQPLLFHSPDGTPLYSPYSLTTALAAMALAHLLVAGPAEALVTGSVVAGLARTRPDLLRDRPPAAHRVTGALTRLASSRYLPLIVTGVLLALTPLGLLAPGGAFGEDAPADLDLGALGLTAAPEGMRRYAGFWGHTLLTDYGADSPHPTLTYLVSGAVGALTIGALVWAASSIGRRLRRRRPTPATRASERPGSAS